MILLEIILPIFGIGMLFAGAYELLEVLREKDQEKEEIEIKKITLVQRDHSKKAA